MIKLLEVSVKLVLMQLLIMLVVVPMLRASLVKLRVSELVGMINVPRLA